MGQKRNKTNWKSKKPHKNSIKQVKLKQNNQNTLWNNLVEDKFNQFQSKINNLEAEVGSLRKFLGLISEVTKRYEQVINNLLKKSTENINHRLNANEIKTNLKEANKASQDQLTEQKLKAFNHKIEEIIKRKNKPIDFNLKKEIETPEPKVEKNLKSELNSFENEPEQETKTLNETEQSQEIKKEQVMNIQCFKCKVPRKILSETDYPSVGEVKRSSDDYWWNNKWTEEQDYCEPCYYTLIKELKNNRIISEKDKPFEKNELKNELDNESNQTNS